MIIITLNGVEGLFTLSLIFSVSVDTIKQWIAENNWDDELKSSRSGHQTFGDRLVFARKLKSYTMEVVSQKLNLSKLEYEKYEKNDAEPEFIIVQQLVDLLGVNPNWLMSGKGKYFNEWVPESDKFSTEKWRNEIRETINSEIKVKKGLMIALRDGLNAYLENQTESSMKNLIELLRKYENGSQPTTSYGELIRKFIDQTIEYYHNNNLDHQCDNLSQNIFE